MDFLCKSYHKIASHFHSFDEDAVFLSANFFPFMFYSPFVSFCFKLLHAWQQSKNKTCKKSCDIACQEDISVNRYGKIFLIERLKQGNELLISTYFKLGTYFLQLANKLDTLFKIKYCCRVEKNLSLHLPTFFRALNSDLDDYFFIFIYVLQPIEFSQ